MLLQSFYNSEKIFEAYTWSHWMPLLVVALLGWAFIFIARNYLSTRQQTILGTFIALLPAVAVVLRMIITYDQGVFTIQDELPLHVCRVLGLLTPIVMYFRNRKWFGIIYFMIIAGTVQANLTPDLDFDFPHYSYFMYWVLHSMLVVLPFYCIFVYGFRVTLRDLWNAFVATNVFMIGITIFNWLTGANYMYTMAKPPSATLLDVMGPWPWYILAGELVALILFIIVYLPFHLGRNRTQSNS